MEGHIGLALFSREKRELRLTRAGEDFSSTLKVSMISYVANEVVIPQLHDFQQQYPDVNLVVQTSMQLENLESQDIDTAIRFGVPPWAGYDVELIHIRSGVNDWERFMDSIGFYLVLKKIRKIKMVIKYYWGG